MKMDQNVELLRENHMKFSVIKKFAEDFAKTILDASVCTIFLGIRKDGTDYTNAVKHVLSQDESTSLVIINPRNMGTTRDPQENPSTGGPLNQSSMSSTNAISLRPSDVSTSQPEPPGGGVDGSHENPAEGGPSSNQTQHCDISESPSDFSLPERQNKSDNCDPEVVNPDLDMEAFGNPDLIRTETDVVHPRLSNNSIRGRLLDIHVETGILTTTGNSIPPLASHSSPVEFRNRSVENLKTAGVKDDKIHKNGNTKQRLRKGLSVNDISECSVVVQTQTNHRNHASVKLSLLKTFGLSRRAPKDEVTQRITSDPGGTHASVIATESLTLTATNRLSHPLDEYRGGGRRKIKNIKKTISNMFHFKGRDGVANNVNAASNNTAESSERKLPSLLKFSKRNKSLPPGKRALPPVPTSSAVTPSHQRTNNSRTPSPNIDILNSSATSAGSGTVSANGNGLEALSAATNGAASDASPRLEGGQEDESQMDFAGSIERVKDHGWYWGPLSGEAAERILAAEPDGSFVVRDSSDQHYIFSLTFKLNGFVRHVRIEHDQGNFSFGSFTKFKSTTIVDFIENAVEHSRSGRYLFFLHRRPVLGPMRVQLLHPVSRFKRVQSLQHLCRYVIVKLVRKDHLDSLPIPNRIKTYLNTPFYYSEQIAEENEEAEENNGSHLTFDHLNLTLQHDQDDNPPEEVVNSPDPAGIEPDQVVNPPDHHVPDVTIDIPADNRAAPGDINGTSPDPPGVHLVSDNQASDDLNRHHNNFSENTSQALTSTSSEFTLETKHLDSKSNPLNNINSSLETLVNRTSNTVANNDSESDHEKTYSKQDDVININDDDSEINNSDKVTESNFRQNLPIVQENEKSGSENNVVQCTTTDSTLGEEQKLFNVTNNERSSS